MYQQVVPTFRVHTELYLLRSNFKLCFIKTVLWSIIYTLIVQKHNVLKRRINEYSNSRRWCPYAIEMLIKHQNPTHGVKMNN